MRGPPATPGLGPALAGTIRIDTCPNTDDFDALVARTWMVPPLGTESGAVRSPAVPMWPPLVLQRTPPERFDTAAVSRTLAPAGRRAGAPEMVTDGRVSVRATEAIGGLRGKAELAETATYWKPSGPR